MKTKTNQKTIADHLNFGPRSIETPWEVYRLFDGKSNTVAFAENKASFSDMGDFATLEELRAAIEWYVKQLNGKVTWDE